MPARATIMTRALVALCAAGAAQAGVCEEKKDIPGAAAARQCTRIAECPTFDEVYAHTPPFRHALAEAFRHGGLKPPKWVAEHELASPMVPLLLDGRSYLVGKTSDPRDSRLQIAVLYDTQRGWITVRYTNAEGEILALGDDAEMPRALVAEYADPSTELARTLSSNDAALPLMRPQRAQRP